MSSVSQTASVKKVNWPLKIFKRIHFDNQARFSENLSEICKNLKMYQYTLTFIIIKQVVAV